MDRFRCTRFNFVGRGVAACAEHFVMGVGGSRASCASVAPKISIPMHPPHKRKRDFGLHLYLLLDDAPPHGCLCTQKK